MSSSRLPPVDNRSMFLTRIKQRVASVIFSGRDLANFWATRWIPDT